MQVAFLFCGSGFGLKVEREEEFSPKRGGAPKKIWTKGVEGNGV